jgi:hypothetical protein
MYPLKRGGERESLAVILNANSLAEVNELGFVGFCHFWVEIPFLWFLNFGFNPDF